MNRPTPRSLSWIIAASFLVVFVVGTAAQVFLALRVLRPLEARDARARAELLATQFEARVQALPADPDDPALGRVLDEVRDSLDVPFAAFVFRRPDGHAAVLAMRPPHEEAPHGPAGPAPDEGGPRPPRDARTPALGERLATRAITRAGRTLGALEVYRLEPPRMPGRRPSDLRALLLGVPVALAASVIAGLLLARLLVRRLRAIEQHAARVASGDLSARIGDTSGDEIGRLAGRLDDMTGRLAEAKARQDADALQRRQLIADITHELATPLTSIRGYAETLTNPRIPIVDAERERVLHSILEESGRMERLIRDLFDLARLEGGAIALEPESLDWAALCRNTAERFRDRFRAANLALDEAGPRSETWLRGDGHRLEQVIENLLVNALRYVPAGGRVTWSVAPASEGRAQLLVADDGPGVPAADLPHLFDRFYRAPGASGASRASDLGGSGLGLAIVRGIVVRHGGTVSAAAVAPHGLAIAVELPLAGPPTGA